MGFTFKRHCIIAPNRSGFAFSTLAGSCKFWDSINIAVAAGIALQLEGLGSSMSIGAAHSTAHYAGKFLVAKLLG